MSRTTPTQSQLIEKSSKTLTEKEKIARLILAHQMWAENFSCSVGAAGWKSEDNPHGECPIKGASLSKELYTLIGEYEAKFGAWSEELLTKAFTKLDQQKEFVAMVREGLEP